MGITHKLGIIGFGGMARIHYDKLLLPRYRRFEVKGIFDISHKAGRANMKYALGTLNAGGEMFLVTIFVNFKDNGYKIQQIKIERLD